MRVSFAANAQVRLDAQVRFDTQFSAVKPIHAQGVYSIIYGTCIVKDNHTIKMYVHQQVAECHAWYALEYVCMQHSKV